MMPIDASLVAAIPMWFQPPIGLTQLLARFGDIDVRMGQVVTPGWESDNMMVAIAPWMPRGRLYVNKHVWPALNAALTACVALGDGYQLRTLGCFAPRPKRVNGDLSTHSWGIAVDINADTNPLAPAAGSPVVKDIPDAWIAEFQKRGFTWGGNFSRPDPMHFQFVSGY